ncbi:glycosyltransferase family 2 protein [bacterium]|nr:glycosyltransferase family 2 protein [bacterium]
MLAILGKTYSTQNPFKELFTKNPIQLLSFTNAYKNENTCIEFHSNGSLYNLKTNHTSSHLETVSVILPVYNAEKTIAQAIASIQTQNHKNIEVIVVDDCSTDNTKSIVQNISETDSRIHYYRLEQNRGSYYCRNYGITQSTGQYITFHDSDDISRPDRIATSLDAIKSNMDIDAVFSDYIRFNNQGEIEATWLGSPYRKGLITFFINATVLKDRLGYFDLVRSCADSEFFERAQCIGLCIKKIDEVLYYARSASDSLSKKGIFKNTNLKGSYTRNTLRECYYISYKTYHRFSEKNLYLEAFPKKRAFDAPKELL